MLVYHRGGYLYEHMPDVFPFSYISDLENAVWCLCYEHIDSMRKKA